MSWRIDVPPALRRGAAIAASMLPLAALLLVGACAGLQVRAEPPCVVVERQVRPSASSSNSPVLLLCPDIRELPRS